MRIGNIYMSALIIGSILPLAASAKPSIDEVMMACAAITANALDRLDPKVSRIAGDEFHSKVMSDCEWLIDGANGDPKLASNGYYQVVSRFERHVSKNTASPLTSDVEKYILTNLLFGYRSAMSDSSHAAGNYKYLSEQAEITKKGMNDIFGKK
ncbi:hypothetical protein [Pectobacterium polaris]|uniref:hypothetical protein n=1 Tax=Pectobacterium polaris TaxID=2042057 RepID=UPI0032EDBD5E